MSHAVPCRSIARADLPAGRCAAAPTPIAPQRGSLGLLRLRQALGLGQMFDLQVEKDSVYAVVHEGHDGV